MFDVVVSDGSRFLAADRRELAEAETVKPRPRTEAEDRPPKSKCSLNTEARRKSYYDCVAQNYVDSSTGRRKEGSFWHSLYG